MASVLQSLPGWWLWLLGGCLDFPCCDPVGGAFLGGGALFGWDGLPLQHFSPQRPILSHLEQWESHVGQFVLLAGCCHVQFGQSLEGAGGVWPLLLWLVLATWHLSWQIVSTGLELWETCSWEYWMVKWFMVMSASVLEGVLNGFAISLPRSFASWQYAWTIWWCSSCLCCSSLIISQLSISDLMHAMKSWGSSPGLATTSFSSPRYTWVLMLCVIPCWILLRKAEAFALVTLHTSLLPVGIHCTCISRELVSRAAKMYQRWSLLSGLMQLRRSQFSRVHWNMEKEWYASFESQS